MSTSVRRKRNNNDHASVASKKPAKVRRAFGPITCDPNLDLEVFERNPCRVEGGETHRHSMYPGSGKSSFAYHFQRLSDRNYAMRCLCIEGSGACYTSFKKRNVTTRCVAWLPESNLNNHANNPTILDTCHMDMVNCKTGECILKAENIMKVANANGTDIECIFLYGYKENPDTIVQAIKACPNLQCFSLNGCIISKEMLQALAQCKNLKGINLAQCENKNMAKDKSYVAIDDALAALLSARPNLSWIFVEDHNKAHMFGTATWTVLSAGACPNLEVLWVDDLAGKEISSDIIRKVVSSRNLKLCMINCDDKLKSSY